MTSSNITPYYDIPTSEGVIDTEQFTSLPQADLEDLLSKDYTITNTNDAGAMLGLFASCGLGGLINLGNGISGDARGEIMSAWVTAKSTLDASIVEAQATCYAAQVAAMSETNAAIATANADIIASENNLEAVKLQTEAQKYDSDNVLEAALAATKVDADSLENDKLNAQANIIAATGEASKDEAKGEADILEAQAQAYESNYSYN